MNKTIITLALSASLLVSSAEAKFRCFTPYDVRVVNQSGGPAELKGSNNVSGMRRGQEINTGSSQRIVVEDNGASARFEFGPEKEETTKTIDFYGKTGAAATVVLGPKGMVNATGFNTRAGEQYDVTLVNKSGGYVDIMDSCGVAFKGSIRDGESQVIKARAGSVLVLKMGPKKAKTMYKIMFSTPAHTGKSEILLQQPGYLNPAIQAKNVNLRRLPVGSPKPQMNTMKRSKPGCHVSNRKADLHG